MVKIFYLQNLLINYRYVICYFYPQPSQYEHCSQIALHAEPLSRIEALLIRERIEALERKIHSCKGKASKAVRKVSKKEKECAKAYAKIDLLRKSIRLNDKVHVLEKAQLLKSCRMQIKLSKRWSGSQTKPSVVGVLYIGDVFKYSLDCIWTSHHLLLLLLVLGLKRPFKGVRSSWDIFAKNSDLYWLDFCKSLALTSNSRRVPSSSWLRIFKACCCDSSDRRCYWPHKVIHKPDWTWINIVTNLLQVLHPRLDALCRSDHRLYQYDDQGVKRAAPMHLRCGSWLSMHQLSHGSPRPAPTHYNRSSAESRVGRDMSCWFAPLGSLQVCTKLAVASHVKDPSEKGEKCG